MSNLTYSELYFQAVHAMPFTYLPFSGLHDMRELIDTTYLTSLNCFSAEHWFVIDDRQHTVQHLAVGNVKMCQRKGSPKITARLHVSPAYKDISPLLPDVTLIREGEQGLADTTGTWLRGAYNIQEHRWEFCPSKGNQTRNVPRYDITNHHHRN